MASSEEDFMDGSNLVTSGELTGFVGRTPTQRRLSAHFVYDIHDPYALTLTMITPSQRPETWTFSRELLEAGLMGGFGSGAVVVAPSPDGREVLIGLHGASDFVVVHLDPGPIRRFLDKSYRAVRPGREHEYINIDEVVAHLLAT
jgi:hypothetical protein